MSSVPPSGNASAQRIPAWKRLGLKLKTASDEGQDATLHTGTVAPPVPNHHRENPTGPTNPNAKRKSSTSVPALDHSAKKLKRDVSQTQTAPTHTPSKRAKSVSFATEPTQHTGSAAAVNSTQITSKQKNSPKKAVTTPTKPAKKQGAVNLEPALAYLRQWHASKDTWKFNKNHQTRLLEQVFADETTIPAVDISIFYEYIRGLKGAVRTRLRELATGTKTQDMELGSKGFPASSKEMTEKRQREYEEVIAAFLRQPRIPGKQRFDEVDYVLRTSDIEMQRRVVKRMRCENVLDELLDSETETVSTTTTTEDSEGALSEGAATAEGVQRLRLNDGPAQRVKRKRKTRTAVVDEDTSSESEPDSDADSDSSSGSSDSSSSDDESGDETAQLQLRAKDDADTSSSSSSSESDSTSEDSDDSSSEDDE
ncbi:hypothetical protein F5Y11DRAFT_245915 [Daldinia sp. FL1419]|nr:hypothetical protein F5Y11DRAFT_245915 [Daldinia sp. FL1419]